MKKTSKIWNWIFGALRVVIVLLMVILLPWGSWNVSSHPNPSGSYAESVTRIEAIQAAEGSNFNPICRTKFLTHGQLVERVIILVHGYTTCSQQFAELGSRFYDSGYNVLIATLPHHGLADRMNTEHSLLTAEELAAYADQVVDIAQGLGKHVVMMGISAGGVTTAWAAQTRSDLDLAVLISPAFGFNQIPTPLTSAVMNIYRLLPDAYEWWDPVLTVNSIPEYGYPRYSKRALVQALKLGFATQLQALWSKPAAKKIVAVFNANDTAVNNALTADVMKIWQMHSADLSSYEFSKDLKLGHDLIDPTQPDQKIEIVYPHLMDLANR